MSQGDCSSTDVDLGFVDVQVLEDSQRLRRESLVQLKQVNIIDTPARIEQLKLKYLGFKYK